MKPNEIAALAKHLSNVLGSSVADRSSQAIEKHLEAWFLHISEETYEFEVTALYDKGFGPECLRTPNVKVTNIVDAQTKAEEMANVFFAEKFQGKVVWEEIKIRPTV